MPAQENELPGMDKSIPYIVYTEMNNFARTFDKIAFLGYNG
jgi:hypothetical protein